MIKSCLTEAYLIIEEYCQDKDYIPFGVFLYGSQNYLTATDSSDVDIKAIVVPNFTRLVKGAELNRVLHYSHGEIDLKDIQSMFNNIKKLNVNFLEILFTDYFIVNPIFKDYWDKIIKIREEIARSNEYQAAQCIMGLFVQNEKKLYCDSKPTTAQDVELYGYHRKSLSNMRRLCETMSSYVLGYPYKECLKSPLAAQYKHEVLDLDYVKDFHRNLTGHITLTFNTFTKKWRKHGITPNYEVLNEVDTIVENCIKEVCKKELLKEK